jgi:HAD superfamily hydrolase (TIGR01509 family)
VVARYGGELSDAQIAVCTGLGYPETHAHVSALLGGRLPGPDELAPEILEALADSFAGGLRRFEDAVGAAAELAFQGIPLAVASASHRSRLDLTLAAADVGRYFPVSVAGDEVAAGKPAPDVYLRAAELLEVRPRDCVAVEDSAPGVRAAAAAGMRVVGVARRPEDIAPLAEAGAGVTPSVDAASLELLLGL